VAAVTEVANYAVWVLDTGIALLLTSVGPAQLEHLTCRLYCEIKQRGYDGAVSRWLDSLTSDPNIGVQGWVLGAKLITQNDWNLRSQIGKLNPSAECELLCECEEQTYDCLQWLGDADKGAWEIPNTWPGQPTGAAVGIYNAFYGRFQTTATTYGGVEFQWGAARLTLPQATIIRRVTVRITTDPAGGGLQAAHAIYLNNNPDPVAIEYTAQFASINLQWTGMSSVSEIAVAFSAYASGYARVTSIEVEGDDLPASLGGLPC
jgi:hypothetical protein